MVHLRLVAPEGVAAAAVERLAGTASVINLVHLPGVARNPDGDLITADVAREDASAVLHELRALGLVRDGGSIALHDVDTAFGPAAEAAERAAAGAPADAVIWEDVTQKTSESATLSGSYVLFMLLAAQIAAVGIYLNSPILVVGAMVVGPEFGPIAGFCVAAVERRAALASRSLAALLVGFPLAIGATAIASLVFQATGITPESFDAADHSLSSSIANPDFFAFFVAFCAGIAGIMSLSTAKSGALIGVLISVTTIPAAANVGVAAAYGDTGSFSGSLQQLAINLASVLAAGTLTLYVQRLLYLRRRGRLARRSSPGRTRPPASP